MHIIQIANPDFLEEHKGKFEFIEKFEPLLILAIKKAKQTNQNITQMLETAMFRLQAAMYYDFGEDNPIAVVEVYIDDDDYLETVDNVQLVEKSISELFEKITPSSLRIPIRVSVNSTALFSEGFNPVNWRKNPGYRLSDIEKTVDQETIEQLWDSAGSLHVFISHKVGVRERAHRLKSALNSFGISSFVAHDDIEPSEEWQNSIEKALFSADALIALITKDFSESDWTDQEVGIAIGQQLPIFPVKLDGERDPYGFIGKVQAFKLEPDTVVKFVKKFIANPRTASPTITSLLTAIQSHKEKLEIIALLAISDKQHWKKSQKDRFAEIVSGESILQNSSVVSDLLQSLDVDLKKIDNTFNAELDDEIPF